MWRRLKQRVGRRGAALLFFAFLDLVYCVSLLAPSHTARRSDGFEFLAGLAPLWMWALLWGLVGVVCLVSAFRRADQAGFAAAISIKMLWGLLFAGGQVFAGLDRGYVSAAVWLALALLVALIAGWPEPQQNRGD